MDTLRLQDLSWNLDPALEGTYRLRLRGHGEVEVVPAFALLARELRAWSPERTRKVGVFTGVYAVGCPLGNDPIPTGGFVSSLRNDVGGCNYWMINAPTYFGNSGGGIFLESTHELVAVFSKIYTHGKGKPVVITHMGLATPISVIEEWLEREGYGFLLAPAAAAANAAGEKAEEKVSAKLR